MNNRNQMGFTFIELFITLSILVILSVFTITSFNNLFQKSQNAIESARLMHAIQVARGESILHHRHVIFCKSNNQKTCSGNWQDGYLILSDNKLIYSFSAHKNNDSLNWRAFPYYSNNVEFLPDGSADFQNGTFWYCPEHAKYPGWAIMISKSGRSRLVLPDPSGKIMDEKEKEMSC